eukprot:6188193-Pleurochrysis_carterae.AAC.3
MRAHLQWPIVVYHGHLRLRRQRRRRDRLDKSRLASPQAVLAVVIGSGGKHAGAIAIKRFAR